MSLIRVAQYSSTPTVVTDYQAQNAHLQAFTNQLLTQQFILDSGTAQPVIKQGTYVSHGGSLYIADADTSITGSPSDGSVYIRVSGTTSLTVEFVNDISGYTWNPVYSALTNGSYTLLPYLLVKASTVWTRYNFNPNNQSFVNLKGSTLAISGNATIGGTLGVTGAITGASVDTGQGATEVHLMNQNLRTTDSPTFASVNTGQGANELYPMNQAVRTTDNVSFANMNPPVDNNSNTLPEIGVGGVTFGYEAIGKTWTMPTGTAFVAISDGRVRRYAGGETTSNAEVRICVIRLA
ncbi:MAG: hypothetical protein WC102_09335 [Saccharofermentanales bacterium]